MMAESIKFLKLHPRAVLPMRGSPLAAGLDLLIVDEAKLEPGQRAALRTGLAVQIPIGFYGRIAPRSSLAVRKGLDVLAGVVDSDYRGEIICVLINFGEDEVFLSAGTRVAQLIIESIATPDAEWSDELDKTDRGDLGFGSSKCESGPDS